MKSSIAYRFSLFSVSLVILTAGVVAAVLYTSSLNLLIKHSLEDLSSQILFQGNRLSHHIESRRRDVLVLSGMPPIQGLIRAKGPGGYDEQGGSSYQQWAQRLSNIFQGAFAGDPNLLQLRYIDVTGKELVRVVRNGNGVTVTPEAGLQDKSTSAYVRNTLNLPKGSIYLSEINLNREYGKIVEPHQEVLRAAIPVYDERNNKIAGLIVLNSDVGYILQTIQKETKITGRDIYITNDRGGYLLHPDKDKTYGFDLGKRYRIQEDIPAMAKLYLPESNDAGLILLPEQTHNNSVTVFNKIYIDPSQLERFIAIGITQSYAATEKEQTVVLRDAVGWSIVLVILGVLAAVIFSIRISQPIKRITQAVEDYTGQGEMKTDLPVDQSDEVGVLARVFQSMVTQVEEAQIKLRQMNRGLDDLVNKRTQELESSEIRQRSIIENMVDGHIVIDEVGIIQDFNQAAENIFSYQANEVIGKNINILMPEPYQSAHDQYMKNYCETGEKKIIGMGREVEGMRKDGSIFPLDLAVNEIVIDGQRIFTGVVRDITERKYIDKMKSEFISTVSHELRTPITSIRGSLGLISGGAVGEIPKQAKEMLKIADNNTERLLILINDILDIQKIESGQMAFNFKNLAVTPFLEQAVQDNAAYGEQHGVKFVIASEASDLSIFADKDRMMQVMANLLSNAAKFSPDDETVEISVARHQSDIIRISVTDHGPGIPEEFQPKLFDRFTQSDSSDTRQEGGTGLGLSITKVIVEKHGGYIDFISHEGVGSTFYVELPELIGEVLHEGEGVPRHLSGLTSSCILIIEDDPDIAALLKRMLAEAGFNSDIAYDVSQARQLLKKNVGFYKAITLDLILPGMGGISFLEELREDSVTQDIPVIVVSVQADEAKRSLQGSVLDVVDWLQKPIDGERLLRAVKAVEKSTRQPRVLHVEDEADVHKVVSYMLKGCCELAWASTFADSKKALEEEDFDLVLLDIGLPDGSGLDLLEIIEQLAVPPRVVIFSAYDVSEEYSSKVSAVLVKSKTNNLKLAEAIKSAIQNKIDNTGKL